MHSNGSKIHIFIVDIVIDNVRDEQDTTFDRPSVDLTVSRPTFPLYLSSRSQVFCSVPDAASISISGSSSSLSRCVTIHVLKYVPVLVLRECPIIALSDAV